MAGNSDNSKAHQTSSGDSLTGYNSININRVASSATSKLSMRNSDVDSVVSMKAPIVAERSPQHPARYSEDNDVPPYSLPPPLNPLPERADFWMEGTPNLLEIVPQPPSDHGREPSDTPRSRYTIFLVEDPYSHILPLPRRPPRAATFAVQDGAGAELALSVIHDVDLERGFGRFRRFYAPPSGTHVRGRFAGWKAIVIVLVIIIAMALATWAGIMFG